MKKIKPLAFYLPQYHPIPQNDEWWGKGFTEWTNVGKAKPLYEGHEQPICPGDLGYYDLRVPEVREQQAEIAKKYGIHGFIYYHYWFGNGLQLLERIANDVLASKKPDFPFCFCWANETWSGIWHGLESKILAKQEYPGEADLLAHFSYLLPFFKDARYIKVDGKPLLMIYDPVHLDENDQNYVTKLRQLAIENGFPGLYIIASNKKQDHLDYKTMGYDAKVSNAFHKAWGPLVERSSKYISSTNYYKNRIKGLVGVKNEENEFKRKQEAAEVVELLKFENANVDTYPMILPGWDNTPRSGKNGVVLINNDPKIFKKQIDKAIQFLDKNKDTPEEFLFIKSWNEWAEGNILEPDMKNGYSYINEIKNALDNKGTK